eukprot:jgi/Botrbrau1/8765/Bobra.0330s0001.1
MWLFCQLLCPWACNGMGITLSCCHKGVDFIRVIKQCPFLHIQ